MSEENKIPSTDAGTAGNEPDKAPIPATNEPGSGAKDEAKKAPQETVPENPFDFTKVPAPADPPPTEESDYTLDFGKSFAGDEAIRTMITGHAREAGISVEAGSRFVAAVCDSLLEQQQARGAAEYKALEKEWGSSFSSNMEGTKQVLNQMLTKGIISEADAADLMTPAVFRMVNHLRTNMSESPALGTNKASVPNGKAEYERIMSDPKSEEFRILMNPNHPKYKETAERMNSLIGMRMH